MNTPDPEKSDPSDDPQGLAENLRSRIQNLEDELSLHRNATEQVAQIVNELNNMLAVMRGHAQLALDAPGSETTAELARVILSSTARAQAIVQRALNRPDVRPELAEKLKGVVRAERARILVVDDEESMCFLMHRLLTKAGYEVTVAHNGQTALAAARKTIFDVAFLDIVLGDIDGVEVFRQLRIFSPTTRAVFLSGDPSIDEVRKTVRDEGADGFITKPFDIYEIQDLVTYILRGPAETAGAEPA
jgi:CheY-like chemotaxis protein